MNGAALLAKAIKRQEVKTVFGLCGHLDVFFGALQDEGVRLIDQRHESAVVHAADAYARVSRSIGVAVVTAGPGLANSIGGIASAWEACTPLLVICGRNPVGQMDMGAHQEMDHPRAVQGITKFARTVHYASRLGEYVDMACRIALSGRPGPVLLDVPSDLQFQKVREIPAEEALGPLVRPSRPLPDPAMVELAAGLLRTAKRPLVVAGSGAYWSKAEAGLRRLAYEFGVPVLGTGAGRGMVDEDRERGFSWALVQSAASQADVVVLAGTRMNGTIGFAAPPFFRQDAKFIQIDVHGEEIGRNRPVAAPIVADCAMALDALCRTLAEGKYAAPDPMWVAEAIKDRVQRIDEFGQEEAGLVHPLRMARELVRRLPRNAILVGDGANCLNWYKAVLDVHESPGYIDHSPFGSMGVGLPFALGAVAASQDAVQDGGQPRPVFLTTGDGAFGFYPAELATSARHHLPFFAMVSNDGGWGANRNSQRRNLGRNFGVDFNQSRYDLVARGFDCAGEFAQTPGEVGAAMDRALSSVRAGQTAVLNVVVDPESGTVRGEDPRLQTVTFNPAWAVSRYSSAD